MSLKKKNLVFKMADKKKRKKKELLEEDWEIDEGSDFPVHERYTKEEPVKEA